MKKPLILITNDDGIDSPGLAAAITALKPLGELLIAAPVTQQTSLSRAFPKIPNLGCIELRNLAIVDADIPAFAIHGSPAYCVSHGVLELADRQVALCVSGINYGENIGLSILPSGTVGAAFEADTYDIPAIAASLEVPADQHHTSEFREQDWKAAIHFLRRLAAGVLNRGYTRDVAVWNLNVPASATETTPWRITKQSRQNYFVFRKPEKRILTEPIKLKVDIQVDFAALEKDSDISCLIVDKHVSLTPLTWNLTSASELDNKATVLCPP